MHLELRTGLKLKLIGDPHLGRNFSVGTPPARRGERELGQLRHMAFELMDQNCHVNVMMGDIFDKFIVDPSVVMATYQMYAEAATSNPQIDYVLIRGNHDVSRDNERFSSFDLLVHMLCGFKNILVVEDFLFYTSRDQTTMLAFMGYNPFISTQEKCEDFGLAEIGHIDAVFGHWDLESYGGDDENLCPFEYLSDCTDTIVTGHVHNPCDYYLRIEDMKQIPKELTVKHHSVRVIGTGSMQPYSHGEDKTEQIYVTRTLEQYEEEMAVDPLVYHDKCLRLMIKQGEEIPDNLDCLQFTYKMVKEDGQEELEVDLGDFEFKKLFMECLEAHGVDEEYQQEMWKTYLEIANAETS
jgi:DNA repair exonuclease SbcCD nuclease subunit